MCSEDRQLNQAKSKPDTVDLPVRTARTIVHHNNSTQYCSTQTVFIYFWCLPSNQHHISDVATWGGGGKLQQITNIRMH